MFDDILYTHYILIYSTHNGDDAPQNSMVRPKRNPTSGEIAALA